ncbi:MAG: 16S rRNA (guanine(966)-N(2))-methyltransferase RsmD [Thermoleophilaceae bacterium]
MAGEFGGRRLAVPRGTRTRPTADRVREALFSILGDISGARVLDLYAGSGALGIEALSRGAESAVFVERNPYAVAAIERNLASLGLDEEIVAHDAERFLERAERFPGRAEGEAIAPARAEPAPSRTTFDLVFCDPPYDSASRLAGPLAERLPALTSEGARIVTESDKRMPLELPFPLLTERTYGDTRIAIHAR